MLMSGFSETKELIQQRCCCVSSQISGIELFGKQTFIIEL